MAFGLPKLDRAWQISRAAGLPVGLSGQFPRLGHRLHYSPRPLLPHAGLPERTVILLQTPLLSSCPQRGPHHPVEGRSLQPRSRPSPQGAPATVSSSGKEVPPTVRPS